MPFAIYKAPVHIARGSGPAALTPAARRNFRRWKPVFTRVGLDMGVAPAFLAAVSKRESNADWEADSIGPELEDGSHARGLMQVTDRNLARMGIADWRNPEVNVRAGARILLGFDYGEVLLSETLKEYGGFDDQVQSHRDDPAPYIEYVLTAYWWATLRHGLHPLPT